MYHLSRGNDSLTLGPTLTLPLIPRAQVKLARLVVEQGRPIAGAAERSDVSWPTAVGDRCRAR